MRTRIDLDSAQVEALDAAAKRKKRSHAALIREAVEDYLAKRSSTAVESAFGIWQARKVDGLAFERRLRNEW